MRKFLLPLFLALALPVGVARAGEGPKDQLVESAMVKVSVKDGDKTIRHPGQECEHQAEYEIFMSQGKTKYLVVVLIDKAEGASKYRVSVTYKRNGKEIVSGDLELAAKKAGSLAKGDQQVTVMVDPAGRVDGRDKIEGPDGDDPLDGAPGSKKKK